MASNEYHDVFLSHRFADREAVQELHDHIEQNLGYSVYVDWIEHPDLDRAAVRRETAEHFRRVMRASGCLLFYAGPNAPESKWMPWELGFFDGRQGARRIAVFVDDLASYQAAQQEYLNLYTVIDRDSLPGFLEEALEDTAALTSATFDQWQRHLDKAWHDPADYALSVMQWCYGVAANGLLDPEKLSTQGDQQPEGPLREPAWFYAAWYQSLRTQQAFYSDMRRQWRAAQRSAGNSAPVWPTPLPWLTGMVDGANPWPELDANLVTGAVHAKPRDSLRAIPGGRLPFMPPVDTGTWLKTLFPFGFGSGRGEGFIT